MMKAVLRENHRYVAVRVISDGHVDRPFIQSIIRNQLLETLGEIGYAKADPKLAYTGQDNTTAIIRCLHSEVEQLRAALSLITDVNGSKIHLMPIFTSGTILKAKKALAKE